MTDQAATETTPVARQGSGRRRRGYFLPGFIALGALVVIGAVLGAGDLYHPALRTLYGPDVASQISLGIQSARSGSAAPTVTCPASEPVRQGVTFTCVVGGSASGRQSVRVTEIDGRGHLHWTLVPAPARTGTR